MRLHTLGSMLLFAAIVAPACAPAREATTREPATPLAVVTAPAAMTDLSEPFETGGIVRARLTATIASRVMAPVVAVHVNAGQRVRRGMPLVDLDAREMRANKERSAAAAGAADQTATAADADVAAAQAGLTLARATHQRIADLAAKKSATPQELDQATAGLSAADAQVRAAEARRASALSARNAASAADEAAQASLTYTQLTAPFDGIVSQRAIDPGTMATPGAPLLTIEDPAAFRLETLVDESRTAQIQLGSRVEVSLSSDGSQDGGTWIPAQVTEIARVDPASHAFVVKIDLPGDVATRSGAFARARFNGPSRKALAVPTTAVVRRGQLAFVFAVDSGSIARLRAISPGATQAGAVEVLAGLTDGERVVDNPPPALTDGHPVQAATNVARGESR